MQIHSLLSVASDVESAASEHVRGNESLRLSIVTLFVRFCVSCSSKSEDAGLCAVSESASCYLLLAS
jgi:hypothetical protein